MMALLFGRTLIRLGALAALAAFTIACNPDDGNAGNRSESALTLTGAVVGTAIPSQAKAVVIWVVPSGSPDYSYKFGGGSSASGSFEVTLVAEPPAQALNSYGLGLGFIVLVDSSQQVPDGIVDDEQLTPMLGFSARHAVIWKNESGPGLSWSDAFPAGYACGKCAPPSGATTFDRFEPVDCSKLEVETAADIDSIESCNWS
jgi:hypothetical protein